MIDRIAQRACWLFLLLAALYVALEIVRAGWI